MTDPEFIAVIEHLAAKAAARIQAGERMLELKVSPEWHEQYSGRIGG